MNLPIADVIERLQLLVEAELPYLGLSTEKAEKGLFPPFFFIYFVL
ncbi:hypothetical protein ACVRXF_07220 [Streptococcus orisasini]